MKNLFNIDIDQIRHNGEYVTLMKWNGVTVYEYDEPIYSAQYTVDKNSTNTLAETGLPNNHDDCEIVIFKSDGSITYDIATQLKDIEKVKIYYSETKNSLNFEGQNGIKTIDYINTSNFTSMENMFKNCTNLTSIDTSKFDTRNVIDMSSMFEGCSSLKSLDLSSFDTSNVTDMSFMFLNCILLESPSHSKRFNLSNFNTEKVTNMRGMFYNCIKLEYLDLSNFDTYDETTNYETIVDDMFSGCDNIINLRLDYCSRATVFDLVESADLRTITTSDPYGEGQIFCWYEVFDYAPNPTPPDGWDLYEVYE